MNNDIHDSGWCCNEEYTQASFICSYYLHTSHKYPACLTDEADSALFTDAHILESYMSPKLLIEFPALFPAGSDEHHTIMESITAAAGIANMLGYLLKVCGQRFIPYIERC